MSSIKSLVTLLVGFTVVMSEEVPSFLHVCRQADPDLTGCLIRSVTKLNPKLISGIPEYGIPSLEPIELGDLLVPGSRTGQGFHISLNDIKAYGSSNWNITRLNVVEYASKYAFDLALPHIYVTGRYNVDGRVLLIPVKGSGAFRGNFTDCAGLVRIKGIHKKIKGQTHFLVNKLDIRIKVKNGNIALDNLFGSEKTLGDIVSRVINENFDVLSKDLIPLIENALARIFKKTANKILERFTLNQLFP